MNKKAKIILSAIGIGAIVVPAILLIVFSQKAPKEPEISSGSRQLDVEKIKEAAEKIPQKPPEFPSPSAATSSASPSPASSIPITSPEGSPSAQ